MTFKRWPEYLGTLARVITLVLSIIAIVIVGASFFQIIIDIFKKNFEERLIENLRVFFWFLLSTTITFLVLSYINVFKNVIKNWKFWTIYLMFFFFVIGLIFINITFGKPELSLYLRYPNNSNFGIVSCNTYDKLPLIVGNKISCDIEKEEFPLNYQKMEVIFIGNNDEILIYNFSGFNAPTNVRKVIFNVTGLDNKDQIIELKASDSFKFLNKDEFEKRNENFTTYFLALLGVVLFSVSTLMYNLKHL